jgi:hypothetical protein
MQMDESTQQNAAMVEEANAAAASMNDQATRLSELTSFFKLQEGASVGATPGASALASIGATRTASPVRTLQPAPLRPLKTPADTGAAMRPSQIFANAAAAAAHEKAETADRRDRRAASRPWSQVAAAGVTASSILKPAATPNATPSATPRDLVTTASGSDWSEF